MTRTEPEWLTREDVEHLHREMLSLFGGSPGTVSEGSLESALGRARNRFAYEERADLFDVAAACCFGLAKKHGFQDANKRTAFVAAVTFLDINGWLFTVDERDAVEQMVALASDARTESEIAAWFRANSVPHAP